MITLKTLQWDNCFSYGSGNVLNLEENTVTQIIGTNGMGKSSIPLIIEEALFNKNSKGIKKADIPNRYVNNGYKIHLEFTKDDNEYGMVNGHCYILMGASADLHGPTQHVRSFCSWCSYIG